MVHSRNSLLAALIVTTVVVTIALSWAGWRLMNLQRDSDQRRVQEQRVAAADNMAAIIRGKLAETGERLSQAAANPTAPLAGVNGGVLVFRADGALNAVGLPFVPAVPDTSSIDSMFDDAEALEFARADLVAAANAYRVLVSHDDPAVRVGALVRLARVAEKQGNTGDALRIYKQLEQSDKVRFKHLPARFIALYQQHAIAQARSDADRAGSLHTVLTDGLDTGEWLLTRDAADYYRDQLKMGERPTSWALAEAGEHIVQTAGAPLSQRGQRVLNGSERNILVMWRGNGPTIAMLAVFLDQFLPLPAPNVAGHLADPSGRWLAGERAVPPDAVEPRVVGDSEYAWILHVGGTAPGGDVPSNRALIAMIGAMLVFLWGAMYFMARAIRREAAVARLQSDFVAAVSHEFRTPLTAIRQMTEMLEAGRVTSSERQQAYYHVLTGEASRLQRLVETLLNFGRMEAGAARYQLEDLDLGALIQRVVQQIDPAQVSGRRIVTSGPEAGIVVRADANALALAVRNLIDNAIKYSPDSTEVRVEWGGGAGSASVRVIDNGIGIPRAEHQAIFEKFVRGRSAIDTSVAGTGVGLAMVRQVLRAHGGAVEVESEVGRGSTFTLTLPLVDSPPSVSDSRSVVAVR